MKTRAVFWALVATTVAFIIDGDSSSNPPKKTSLTNLTERRSRFDIRFEPVHDWWESGRETGDIEYMAYSTVPKTYIVRIVTRFLLKLF